MKHPVLNKILLICGITAAMVYFVFSLYSFTPKKQDTVCKQLKIVLLDQDGIQLVRAEDIERYLKTQGLHPVGKELKQISSETIERALQKNSLIKSSECYSTPNGTTCIYIEQCCPKFRVIGSKNYYVDTERNKIAASTDYTAYVPIVSGYVTDEMATGDLFDFITFLERNTFWDSQIEQIYVRADKKIELVPRVGNSIILLGTLNDYPQKLEKLKKLYVNGFNKIGWNNYKTIDLQYKGQIVCTRANE